VPGEKGVVRTFLNIEAGGLSVRQERIRAFFSASTRPNKRATSLWMMALAEWLGSLKGGEAGRLKAGMHYRDLAAIYEWGLGVAALSAAILFLNGSNLAGVLAPLIGSASGGLFFLSHTLLPASWVPKTLSRDDIGFPKVLTMTLVYSAAITLSLWGVFGVEAFGLTPSGVGALALPVWSFALLTHALFDGWAHRTKRFVNRWKTSINSIPYLDVLWTGVGKIVALILLPLALVLMGIQIPFVRMGSPGPIFYWHPRAGHDGRLIKVLKIRTMTRGNNPDGPPYATPYGRVVRPIGLDEIPQIFSILTGTTRWFGARYMPNEIAEIDPEGSLFHDAYPGVFNSHYLSAERTECADGNFVPLYKSRLKSDLRDVQQRSILYRTRLFLEIARKWRLNLWLSIRRLKTGTSRGLGTHPILKTLAPGTTLRIGVSEYAFGADGMSYSDINRSGNHLWVHGQPVPLEMARETVENLRVKASVLGKAVGMNEDPASIGLATSNVGMNTGYFIYRKGKLFRNAREKDAGTLHLWMGTNQAGVTSFRKLRFRNEKNAWIPSDENDAPVTDLTAAFRGPVLIQDGAPAINPDEWDDIRHLFRLPVFDHLPNFPGGSLTWGLADGKGELHGNLELRRRAFQGEAVTLALEPLSALGLDLQRIEETFREWGYQRREEAFEIKKPGDYFIDEIKNTATVRFLPGVHPHTVIGQDASKRLVVVTVLGETNQRGADLRQLAAALAKQGVRDALMVANGKDVMILQSSGNLAVKNARQKVSALLALFPPSGSRVPKDKTLSPFKTHDLFDGWSHSTKPVVHYLSTPSTPRTGVMVLFLLMPFLLLGDPTQGNLPAWLGSASGLGGFLPLLLGSMKNQVEPFSTASPAFERLIHVMNTLLIN
jgi:lipopolysaccharide/colanic/teichoic acid biosynthesis glycosyltransferase